MWTPCIQTFQTWAVPFPFLHVTRDTTLQKPLRFRDAYHLKNLAFDLLLGLFNDYVMLARKEETGRYADPQYHTNQQRFLIRYRNKIWCRNRRGSDVTKKITSKKVVFSHRNEFGQWDPKNQRPWASRGSLQRQEKRHGEHFRIFPLNIGLKLTFGNTFLENTYPFLHCILHTNERRYHSRQRYHTIHRFLYYWYWEKAVKTMTVRCRTIGIWRVLDSLVTGKTVEEIIQEVAACRISERNWVVAKMILRAETCGGS